MRDARHMLRLTGCQLIGNSENRDAEHAINQDFDAIDWRPETVMTMLQAIERCVSRLTYGP